jgi:hypothetical protein
VTDKEKTVPDSTSISIIFMFYVFYFISSALAFAAFIEKNCEMTMMTNIESQSHINRVIFEHRDIEARLDLTYESTLPLYYCVRMIISSPSLLV